MRKVPSDTAVIATTGLILTLRALRCLVDVANQIVKDHDVGKRGNRAIEACNAVVNEVDDLRQLFATPMNRVHVESVTTRRGGLNLDVFFGNEATRRLQTDLKKLIEEAVRKLDEAGSGRKFDLETTARKYREPLPKETPLGVVELGFAYHAAGASDLKPLSKAFKETATVAWQMLGTLFAQNLYEVQKALLSQRRPCLLGQQPPDKDK